MAGADRWMAPPQPCQATQVASTIPVSAANHLPERNENRELGLPRHADTCASCATSERRPGARFRYSAACTGTVVTANESDFKISLSSTTFTPGRYTFIAKNVGQTAHALEIDGPGVSDRKTPTISPGASTPGTVALQKGSYEIYCPVDSHKAMGMDLHITVS